MLKEEFRNMERNQKREGVDLTYLKNVILKLLETGIFLFGVPSSPAAPSSLLINTLLPQLPHTSQNTFQIKQHSLLFSQPNPTHHIDIAFAFFPSV